jgi:hypothetical protein
MGLDITLYEFTSLVEFRAGSYSGFGEFRELLAKSAGMVLDDFHGFGGKTEWTHEETYYELLNHSDCDWDLRHYECVELIKDFTPENREVFSKTLKDEFPKDEDERLVEYYLGKWDKWKEVIGLCAENDNYLIEFH